MGQKYKLNIVLMRENRKNITTIYHYDSLETYHNVMSFFAVCLKEMKTIKS